MLPKKDERGMSTWAGGDFFQIAAAIASRIFLPGREMHVLYKRMDRSRKKVTRMRTEMRRKIRETIVEIATAFTALLVGTGGYEAGAEEIPRSCLRTCTASVWGGKRSKKIKSRIERTKQNRN